MFRYRITDIGDTIKDGCLVGLWKKTRIEALDTFDTFKVAEERGRNNG